MNFLRPFVLPLLLTPMIYAADTLLPMPRHVAWGQGSLPVAGLSIAVAPDASAADRFAASRLSEVLTAVSGATVPIGSKGQHVIRFVREGADAPLAGVNETVGKDSREAYTLKLTPGGGELRARSSAGLFYGVETVRQLAALSKVQGALPAVEIEDWPALAYRGLMMDTAHGPLPTVSEIERQIEFIARFKYNQYYFYAETNIEMRGYPLLSYGGRYTRADIQRIVAYARDRHIDVVPCLEFYGHLHDFLKLESSQDLGVLPHGGEINPRAARIQEIQADWLKQMAELFPSPWFHAGLDEPWELERAPKEVTGGVPPATLFVEHLRFVCERLKQLGKHPMYWADVSAGAQLFTRYPELASRIPNDAIAVSWDYDENKDFTPAVKPLADRHVPFFVATGIWHWEDISPRFTRTFSNMDGFVAQGTAAGARGVIHTAWTDAAQASYRQALAAFAYGGTIAWQAEPVHRATFFADYARIVYPSAVARDVAEGIAAMASAQDLLNEVLGGETAFRVWDIPFTVERLERYRKHLDQLRRARLAAEKAEAHFITALEHPDPSGTLSNLLVGARLADYAAMKALYAVELEDWYKQLGSHPKYWDVAFNLGTQGAVRNHSRVSDLMDTITDLRECYRHEWLEQYTSWRMASALGRWDAEYEYWRRVQTRMLDFTSSFKEGSALPSLQKLTMAE